MARAGRKDRGLVEREDASGKPVWYVRLVDNGKERWFGKFASKTDARDFYEERKSDQRNKQFFPSQYQKRGQQTVKQLIEAFMATNTKLSVSDDRRFAKMWIEYFREAKISAVTAGDIERMQQRLQKRGLAPGTINRVLAFLRHIFHLAVKDKDCALSVSPMAQVKFLKEPKGRIRYLSPEEETKLLYAIGKTYAPWVRFAILTGLRQMEQFSLRWEHVDLERGVTTLTRTKAGEVQYMHLNREAQDILRNLDSWQRSVWVFPSNNPRTHVQPLNFYRRHYRPAVKALRLDGVNWHTLRHTFASRLAMSGATEQDIAACLRHSTTALVTRYAHLSPSHLKGVVEKVASFGALEAPMANFPVQP